MCSRYTHAAHNSKTRGYAVYLSGHWREGELPSPFGLQLLNKRKLRMNSGKNEFGGGG